MKREERGEKRKEKVSNGSRNEGGRRGGISFKVGKSCGEAENRLPPSAVARRSTPGYDWQARSYYFRNRSSIAPETGTLRGIPSVMSATHLLTRLYVKHDDFC